MIRRTIGYQRLSGIVAGQALAQLFEFLRLYVNCFQPSFKLRERIRQAGRMKKTYHPPATRCERLLEHPLVEESTKEALRKQLIELDPVTLLHGIRQGQSALAALSQGDPGNGPERQSLNEFLAKLPEMQEKYPGWFDMGQLRTLQRRVGEWRQSMARTLILEGVPAPIVVEPIWIRPSSR